MSHPLFNLARKLERRRRANLRTRRAMDLALNDPHLARDVGLPYRPAPKPRTDLW